MKKESGQVQINYFEELNKKSPLVNVEVVLEDLILLDEGQEKLGQEERIKYLSKSLYARKFFNSYDACQDMARLFLEIKSQHPFVNVHQMHEFFRKLRQYERLRRQAILGFLVSLELQQPKRLPLTSEELKDLGMERWRGFSARMRPLTKVFAVLICFLNFGVLSNWVGNLIRPLETITWVWPTLVVITGIILGSLVALGVRYALRTGKWENLSIFLAIPLCFAGNWKVAIVVVFATIIARFEYTQELIYKNKILQLKKTV